MRPLTVVALAGAGCGVGLVALIWELRPPRPSIAATLAFLDPPADVAPAALTPGEGGPNRIGQWLATRGLTARVPAADLAVLGRRPDQFTARQALTALAGLLAIPAFALLLAAAGVALPWPVPVGLALLAAAAGWWAPAIIFRLEAAAGRRHARDVLSAYLDLVALAMASGRGVPEALTVAAAMSDSPLVTRLTDTLADARLAGRPSWTALGRVGAEWDLPELRELAATLALVYDEGAKARQTLLARAAGLRRRQLTDAAGRADARSEVMLAATYLLYAGFAVLILYPALIRIFTL